MRRRYHIVYLEKPTKLLRDYFYNKPIRKIYKIPVIVLKIIGFRNTSSYIKKHINEDVFWTQLAPKLDKTFRVAEYDVAIRFSFECQPARLFDLNNKQLPFGCHAWEKI